MIRITSKNDGFRRCGVAHSASPTDWPDGRFTEEELGRLQSEPMLSVEVVVEAEGKPGAKPKKKDA